MEAICECQEFAPGLLSYLLWTMNPRRKKNRFHVFKDQQSNVNKPFSSVAYEKALHFKWRGCNARRLFRLYSTLLQDSFVSLTFKSVDENLWCRHSSETPLVESFHASIYFLGFYHPPPPPKKKNCVFVIFFFPWALLGGVQSSSRYDWGPQSKLSTAPIHAPPPLFALSFSPLPSLPTTYCGR